MKALTKILRDVELVVFHFYFQSLVRPKLAKYIMGIDYLYSCYLLSVSNSKLPSLSDFKSPIKRFPGFNSNFIKKKWSNIYIFDGLEYFSLSILLASLKISLDPLPQAVVSFTFF